MKHTIIEYIIMLFSTFMFFKSMKIIVYLIKKDIKHDKR
jgi:hypothetical protein